MDKILLDSVYTIQTPEGIDIHLKVAGVWPRSLAWIIDLMIRGVMYVVLSLSLNAFGDFGSGLLLICIFLIEWFYPVLFEMLNKGMTPGKAYLNIQVLNNNGTPIGWSASLLRNTLRTVDFLPFAYGLGFISMLMNDRFQRLGDLAADTLVVYTQQTRLYQRIDEQHALKPVIKLTLKEQKAIIHYAERSHALSDERLDELAQILNILDVDEQKMTKEKLVSIANGLIGR